MEINKLIGLIIHGALAFAVVFIGIPLSLYLIKKGIEGFLKYGLNKLPNNYLKAPGLGTYSFEVFFYGLFLFIFNAWYLFLGEGGHLIEVINKTRSFH